MSLLSFLYNFQVSINLLHTVYCLHKFIPTKTWYILRLQNTQNVNNLMSVFVKRQTHDIQKMKSFNQQREKERMRSICLLLLYFMLVSIMTWSSRKTALKVFTELQNRLSKLISKLIAI